MTDFENFVAKQPPYPWTITRNHPNEWLNGNSALVVNMRRFERIVENLKKYYKNGSTILDVGVFPGLMPQIFYNYFPRDQHASYIGAGLGFTEEFELEMSSMKIKLIQADLEPRLKPDSSTLPSKLPIENVSVDMTFFTDVIEHFFDPFYPLTEINRTLKMGGILILTTDNINRYENLNLFLRGRSPNVPLIESNIFYNGPWRPHFREFSKHELVTLLDWAGFEVAHHEFFEAEFGSYRIKDGNLHKREDKGLKALLRSALKNLLPHLKDNHLIVARKVREYDPTGETSPTMTSDIDAWVNLRKHFSK